MSKYVVNILKQHRDGTRTIHDIKEFTSFNEAINFTDEFNGCGFVNKYAHLPIEVKD